jgi:hypothetical protein
MGTSGMGQRKGKKVKEDDSEGNNLYTSMKIE